MEIPTPARSTACADARILIVDDHADNVELLQRLLAKGGYRHTHGVTDPRRVAELLREIDPDLILLDLHMPHLDGFTLLDRLRRVDDERDDDDDDAGSTRLLPVLVLTADRSSDARHRALAAGASDVVTKPFEVADVLLRVGNHLRVQRTHQRERRRSRELRGRLARVAAEGERAERVWRTLVPERLELRPPWSCWSTSRPAGALGGDLQLAGPDWLAVADVSGKGVPAALFTGMIGAALRLALPLPDPGPALAAALEPPLLDAGMIVTLAALRLAPDGGAELLSLGHPPALLRRADGRVERLGATDPPLGTVPPRHPPRRLRLAPGDLLCLYSDGLDEATRRGDPDERFGVERIATALAGAATPDAAARALLTALEPFEVHDDLTLTVVGYRP